MHSIYNTNELRNLSGKTIVITGAKGMLGKAFQFIIDQYSSNVTVHAFGKDELDVTDLNQVNQILSINPDFIIHCAAIVDADYCEHHLEEATLVKIKGIEHVIEVAKKCNAKVFYPQSFLIFDGKELPITENTKPNPSGVYGNLKYLAEIRLLDEMDDALVVRMAGFFGGEEKDKNFVGKIVPHISKLMHEGTGWIEIGDRVWQPTYTNDLAYNSLVLLANDKKGVYCMASQGEASFYELTCEIANTLELNKDFSIHKVSAQEVSTNESAKRPDKAIIENLRLKSEGLDRQRSWKSAINEYINQDYFRKLFSDL